MAKLLYQGHASFQLTIDCGGDPYKMYKDYIDGKKEIAEINMEYHANYLHG